MALHLKVVWLNIASEGIPMQERDPQQNTNRCYLSSCLHWERESEDLKKDAEWCKKTSLQCSACKPVHLQTCVGCSLVLRRLGNTLENIFFLGKRRLSAHSFVFLSLFCPH